MAAKKLSNLTTKKNFQKFATEQERECKKRGVKHFKADGLFIVPVVKFAIIVQPAWMKMERRKRRDRQKNPITIVMLPVLFRSGH